VIYLQYRKRERSIHHSENTPAIYREARHQGKTEDGHFGHCRHISESANVKVQTVFQWEMAFKVP
jgi:hypothetical protein